MTDTAYFRPFLTKNSQFSTLPLTFRPFWEWVPIWPAETPSSFGPTLNVLWDERFGKNLLECLEIGQRMHISQSLDSIPRLDGISDFFPGGPLDPRQTKVDSKLAQTSKGK